jgi:hypothetical protein
MASPLRVFHSPQLAPDTGEPHSLAPDCFVRVRQGWAFRRRQRLQKQVPLNERLRQQGCRVGVGRRRSRNREKQPKSDEMSENCFFRSFHLFSFRRDKMRLCTPLASPHAGQSSKNEAWHAYVIRLSDTASPSSELFHQSAQ